MTDKSFSSGVFFNHERAGAKEPRVRGWRRALSASSQGRSPLPPRPALVANTSCSLGVRATKTLRDTKAFTLVGRTHENASRFYSNEPSANVEAARAGREPYPHVQLHCSTLAWSRKMRSIFVKSTGGLNVFVSRIARFRDGRTGTTPKAGVVADVGGAGRRRSLRTRDGGERGNRALRDARAAGSWLAPQGSSIAFA